MSFAIGPFVISGPLGEGGMGTVWRGHHDREGVPIALKVLRGHVAREQRFVDGFAREVEAVARLHHPGIVLVYDRGAISEREAHASGGRFEVDASWVALELVEGGTLAAYRCPESWSELSHVLMGILDALSHAHGRGVLHRDIKPSNILASGPPSQFPAIKLTDFGIARAVDRVLDDAERQVVAGTPTYMAPEQILGEWREEGPWTDLYALGCVAFEMVSGRPPFASVARDDIWRGHLFDDVPPLNPRYALPEDFERWLRRLLHKSPRERFGFAADAASELEAMDTGGEISVGLCHTLATVVPRAPLDPDDAPTVVDALLAAEISGMATGSVADRELETSDRRDAPVYDLTQEGAVGPSPAVPAARGVARAIPASWRQREAHRSKPLAGSGAGLLRLREVPLVARVQERDVLWAALRGVATRRTPQAVVLHGSAGAGKSRLARWLCRRAEEVGAAHVLVAENAQDRSGMEVLSAMLARLTRNHDLVDEAWTQRVQMALETRGLSSIAAEDLSRALTDVLWVRAESGMGRTGASRQAESRLAVFAELLVRLSQERPVVVWLDDVHFGLEALKLAALVLARRTSVGAAILFVATVREDLLPTRPDEKHELDALERWPAARAIRIEPLRTEDHAELVRRTLSLNDALADRVVERTQGNPLFAIQLIEDWVQRGALRNGESGFELADDAGELIPKDVEQLWTQRLAAVEAVLGLGVVRALQVAALLGDQVSATEWFEAARAAGIDLRLTDTDELVRRQLLVRVDTGWAFIHSMLRETLQVGARVSGSWKELNSACADALAGLQAGGHNGLQGRLGMHLLAAERYTEAARELVSAFEQSLREANHVEALRYSALAERALQLGRVDAPALEAQLLLLKTWLAEREGRGEAAAQTLASARELVVQHALDHLEPEVVLWQAQQRYREGQLDDAVRLAMHCAELFANHGGTARSVAALSFAAQVRSMSGNPTAALAIARHAVALAERSGEPHDLGNAQLCLGLTARANRQLELAQSALIAARASFHAAKAGVFEAASLTGLANLARDAGNYEAAAEHYRESMAIDRLYGGRTATVSLANLGVLAAHRGSFVESASLLERARELFDAQSNATMVTATKTALLPAMAALEDWQRFDRYLSEAVQECEAHGFAHRDSAWSTETAGRLLLQSHPRRARGALELAGDQWRALGAQDDVERIETMLGSIDEALRSN